MTSRAHAPSRAPRMRELPAEARPRERLRAVGPRALSDAELVALLLGHGDAERSALDLAQQLLADAGGDRALARLSESPLAALCAPSGLGPAKASRLIAAFEIGRRVARTRRDERASVSDAESAHALLTPLIGDRDREHFAVLYLDAKHRVIEAETIAVGTLTAALVHPRELYKGAVARSAAAVLVGHNHPSGDPTPSHEDRALTRRLMEAGEILGIRIVDHLILGNGRYVSLREASDLWTRHSFHLEGTSPGARASATLESEKTIV